MSKSRLGWHAVLNGRLSSGGLDGNGKGKPAGRTGQTEVLESRGIAVEPCFWGLHAWLSKREARAWITRMYHDFVDSSPYNRYQSVTITLRRVRVSYPERVWVMYSPGVGKPDKVVGSKREILKSVTYRFTPFKIPPFKPGKVLFARMERKLRR